jgi:hypothetical protein
METHAGFAKAVQRLHGANFTDRAVDAGWGIVAFRRLG